MLLMAWATHVLQWQVQREAKPRGGAKPKKLSQFRLQAEIRLYEDGLASNCRSAYCSEYVLGPCTHRPSRHESRKHPKPVSQPEKGAAVEGGFGDWGEVVTREPYRKVRLDHLLSKEQKFELIELIKIVPTIKIKLIV